MKNLLFILAVITCSFISNKLKEESKSNWVVSKEISSISDKLCIEKCYQNEFPSFTKVAFQFAKAAVANVDQKALSQLTQCLGDKALIVGIIGATNDNKSNFAENHKKEQLILLKKLN